MDARRGSGVSIPANAMPATQTVNNTMMESHPGSMSMSDFQSLYHQHQGTPAGYFSPGPILVNPPHMPTYSYGIPPSPVPPMMHQGYMGSGHFSHPSIPMMPMKQQQSIRRSGSINAKIFNAEARRPFANARIAESEMIFPGYSPGVVNANYSPAPGTNPGKLRAFDEASAVAHLRKNQIANEENFMEKIKDWETSTQQNLNANKVEDAGELPGLVIEEMLESASMIDGENVNEEGKENEKSLIHASPEEEGIVAVKSKTPLKWRQATPLNTAVLFVPQQEAWIVERMGKYHKTLEPGMNVLVPLIDKVKYVHSLKEITVDIPHQVAVSSDNVSVKLDGVMFLQITDAYKASYEIEDPEYSMIQLAQTSTRSELASVIVDDIYKDRDNLSAAIMLRINTASEAWGISCIRYEIRDMILPISVHTALQMQVEAERKKRAAILESEGIMAAEVNVAEGRKQARILSSEAEKQELINSAEGAAQAVVAAGEARATSIEIVAKALSHPNGGAAASLAVAEQYVASFGQLAKQSTTVLLPANTGDVGSMVAQAMAVYNKMNAVSGLQTVPEENEGEETHRSEVNINLD